MKITIEADGLEAVKLVSLLAGVTPTADEQGDIRLPQGDRVYEAILARSAELKSKSEEPEAETPKPEKAKPKTKEEKPKPEKAKAKPEKAKEESAEEAEKPKSTNGKPKAEKAKTESSGEPVTAEQVREAITKAATATNAKVAIDELERVAGVRKASLVAEEHFAAVVEAMTSLVEVVEALE